MCSCCTFFPLTAALLWSFSERGRRRRTEGTFTVPSWPRSLQRDVMKASYSSSSICSTWIIECHWQLWAALTAQFENYSGKGLGILRVLKVKRENIEVIYEYLCLLVFSLHFYFLFNSLEFMSYVSNSRPKGQMRPTETFCVAHICSLNMQWNLEIRA